MFESISNITHPMQTLFIYILVRLLFLKVSEEVAHMQALIHIHREKKTPIHVIVFYISISLSHAKH